VPNLPLVAEALWDLGQQIQFAVIGKTTADFQVIENTTSIVDFVGVLQPIPPRKLLVKPEGQRTWKWYTLYTSQELELDWVISDEMNKAYRVMSRTDWSQAGYAEYELTEKPR